MQVAKRLSGFALVALVVTLGCALPGKLTGGGWIYSKAGNGKANFGFNASSCDDEISGRFNYHDMEAYAPGGVKMQGSVLHAEECVEFGEGSPDIICSVCGTIFELIDDGQGGRVYGVALAYRSTNPKYRGEGEAVACAVDRGEGGNSPDDLLGIKVLDGPFAGYLNAGRVSGNLQAHECPGNQVL